MPLDAMISKEAFVVASDQFYPEERKYRFAEVLRSLAGIRTDVPECRHCGCNRASTPVDAKRHDVVADRTLRPLMRGGKEY